MAHPVTFGGAAVATAAVAVAALVVVPAAGDYWEVDATTADAAAIEITDEPLDDLVSASTIPASTIPASTTLAPTAPAITESPARAAPSTTVAAPATTTTPTTTEPPLPELARPVRIIVAGDSTADATGAGVLQWAAAHPDLAQAEVMAMPGCGFMRGGERKVGEWETVGRLCDEWLDRQLPDRIAALQPDVVVLMTTSWDLLDRRWDGETVLTPLDPEYAERMATDFAAVTDDLLAAGAGSVAWIRPPIPNVWWMNQGTGQEDPTRHAVANATYAELAATRPGDVGVIPLDEWLVATGLADDESVRPDGVHWDPDAAHRIAEEYLGERIIRVALA